MQETPESWLAARQHNLAVELEGKTCIYLDTNFWIELEKVVRGEPRFKYDMILARLEHLRLRKEMFCPLSQPLIEELMRMSGDSRRRTAAHMDFFGSGVCLRPLEELVAMQWHRDLTRLVLQQPVQWTEEPWTKIGFWAGSICSGYSQADWELTVERFQERSVWKSAHAYTSAWVQDVNRLRRVDRSFGKLRFPALFTKCKCDLIHSLEHHLKSCTRRLCLVGDDTADELFGRLALLFIETDDLTIMPTLQVLAGLEAVATWNGRGANSKNPKKRAHDFFDFLHAAVAVPYCTSFFTERSLAQLLDWPDLRFPETYGKVVLTDPDEVISYLEP